MLSIKISIILILLSCNVFAGEIFYGYVENASQYDLQQAKENAHDTLKHMSQPADMFGYEYFPEKDILVLWGQKDKLLQVDKLVSAYQNGIIKTLGVRKYNREGYIRDDEFYSINKKIREWRDAEYAVIVSTL